MEPLTSKWINLFGWRAIIFNIYFQITQYSGLEGTHKDHQVHLFREWLIEGWTQNLGAINSILLPLISR